MNYNMDLGQVKASAAKSSTVGLRLHDYTASGAKYDSLYLACGYALNLLSSGVTEATLTSVLA